MMQSDFFKMTQAQESLFRVSTTINQSSQDEGVLHSVESDDAGPNPKAAGVVMLDQYGNRVNTNP